MLLILNHALVASGAALREGRGMTGPSLTTLIFLAACGGGSTPGLETRFADPDDPNYAASFEEPVDERISRSRGPEGGLVVLWPRVVPASEERGALASEIQARLHAIAEAQGVEVDRRPQPERACPRGGCEATALGAVLLSRGGGCAVVATLQLPGESAARLVRWAGALELRQTNVPFREPPENQIEVVDMARCSELGPALEERAAMISSEVESILRIERTN